MKAASRLNPGSAHDVDDKVDHRLDHRGESERVGDAAARVYERLASVPILVGAVRPKRAERGVGVAGGPDTEARLVVRAHQHQRRVATVLREGVVIVSRGTEVGVGIDR